MPRISTDKDTELFYVDYGTGHPVILIHGWPLSHKAWESQIAALVDAGFRVVAYDRRGFGSSSAPFESYDYDALASDLNEIITQLNLVNVSLVGFSMGGGEVVRYLTNYGDGRISKAVLIASIIPLVKQKEDNPDGVPQKMLDEILTALRNDRIGFLTGFSKNFYNYTEQNKTVSQEQLDYDWSIAAHASPRATIGAAKAWMDTDFREEAKNISVPTLIIHGDSDNTVPIKTSADQAARLIPGNTCKIYKDGAHGLNVTHKDQLNKDLIEFLEQ